MDRNAIRKEFLFNVHPLDQSVTDAIGVMHNRINYHISFEIPDYPMDFDNESALIVGFNAQRVDMRVEGAPLSSPVCANRILSMEVTAFHSVCPLDGRMHARQHCVDAARVEVCVGRDEDLPLVH